MRDGRIFALAAAAVLAFAACNEDASPTEPILREPTPTPPTSALLGQWHGTMSYAGGGCASEDVNATVVPEGSGVRLNVWSLCDGNVIFRLEEQPPAVSGRAELRYNGSCNSVFGPLSHPMLTANVSGTAESGRLHLETMRFTMPLVSCNRAPVALELAR